MEGEKERKATYNFAQRIEEGLLSDQLGVKHRRERTCWDEEVEVLYVNRRGKDWVPDK